MTQPKKGKPDRDVMLSQAEMLFAEQGFGACSLRDVLKAMRCSTTAFYARFDSKDEVFEALITELLDDLTHDAVARLADVRGVSEGFDVGVEMLVEILAPHKRLISLALSEGAALEPIRALLADRFEGLVALMQGQLELAGVDDAHDRAWALVGSVHMQIVRWAVFEQVPDARLADAMRTATRPLLPH